ncbi:MAG: hypothetical protein RR432_05620, partial [Alistipes sp.]
STVTLRPLDKLEDRVFSTVPLRPLDKLEDRVELHAVPLRPLDKLEDREMFPKVFATSRQARGSNEIMRIGHCKLDHHSREKLHFSSVFVAFSPSPHT